MENREVDIDLLAKRLGALRCAEPDDAILIAKTMTLARSGNCNVDAWKLAARQNYERLKGHKKHLDKTAAAIKSLFNENFEGWIIASAVELHARNMFEKDATDNTVFLWILQPPINKEYGFSFIPACPVEKEDNTLTVAYIEAHKGEIITWQCWGYKGNLPYKGKCRLLGLEDSQEINPATKKPYRRPVIEHIAGSNLANGWVEYDYITYSDGDRPVFIADTFDIYTGKYDLPNMGYLRFTGNPMQYSIVVPKGANPSDVFKKEINVQDGEFDLVHEI